MDLQVSNTAKLWEALNERTYAAVEDLQALDLIGSGAAALQTAAARRPGQVQAVDLIVNLAFRLKKEECP